MMWNQISTRLVMGEGQGAATSRTAMVVDVGRTAIRIGLTDDSGLLRTSTVRAYSASDQSTVSGAMTSFARENGMREPPSRCGIAVSGAPRGDTIVITHSRWLLSRSGLTAMLGTEPLILNDFAANAWAFSGSKAARRIESLNCLALTPTLPGAYCIIGVGSGLGVALLCRDEFGIVNVVPSEAGHTDMIGNVLRDCPVAEMIAAQKGFLSAETLLSAPGLLALYAAWAKRLNVPVRAGSLGELLARERTCHDPAAVATFDYFAKALWHFAGNMVLAYGAWDGLILTGSIVGELRGLLAHPNLASTFAIAGPFERRLREVPLGIGTFEHAELEGASVALLMHDLRRDHGRSVRSSPPKLEESQLGRKASEHGPAAANFA